MYKINQTKNSVSKLKMRLFKDLKLRERENLQEWIADNPEMLGEELLIIQKEFNGFSETNERLDLLALDKDGGLVIIENKLDDTGKDVVWQALKYTSYCSTLTTEQIISIYQEYLDTTKVEKNAVENITSFLEFTEEELLLNDKDQRIIFVANKYRKEVTSTVLWLINHDINIKCFRAIPYSMGEDLFLQIEQIIPLPETSEYIIDIKEKEKEAKKIKDEGNKELIAFWSMLKQHLLSNKFNHVKNVTPRSKFSFGFSKEGAKFAYCIGHEGLRVEMYFKDDANKQKFEAMLKWEKEIQRELNNEVVWQRLKNKKASRIKLEIEYSDIKTENSFWHQKNIEQYIDWYSKSMNKFYPVMFRIWNKAQKELV